MLRAVATMGNIHVQPQSNPPAAHSLCLEGFQMGNTISPGGRVTGSRKSGPITPETSPDGCCSPSPWFKAEESQQPCRGTLQTCKGKWTGSSTRATPLGRRVLGTLSNPASRAVAHARAAVVARHAGTVRWALPLPELLVAAPPPGLAKSSHQPQCMALSPRFSMPSCSVPHGCTTIAGTQEW
mgnify:CR=1 FL=1